MAAHKGSTPWNKGLRVNRDEFPTMGHFQQHTTETKELISLSRMGKALGEENGYWSGDSVGYAGLHKWLKLRLGRALVCSYCGHDGRIEWASISHKAKRDLNDYIPLCVPCHRTYDKKVRG